MERGDGELAGAEKEGEVSLRKVHAFVCVSLDLWEGDVELALLDDGIWICGYSNAIVEVSSCVVACWYFLFKALENGRYQVKKSFVYGKGCVLSILQDDIFFGLWYKEKSSRCYKMYFKFRKTY